MILYRISNQNGSNCRFENLKMQNIPWRVRMRRREQNVAEGQLARNMFITIIMFIIYMHDEQRSGKSSLAALYSTPLHAILTIGHACPSSTNIYECVYQFVMDLGNGVRGSIYKREIELYNVSAQYYMHLHIW